MRQLTRKSISKCKAVFQGGGVRSLFANPVVSSSRTNKDQTTRKRTLLSYQHHNPSTCKAAVAEHWGIILNYQSIHRYQLFGSDSVIRQLAGGMDPLWSHVSESS